MQIATSIEELMKLQQSVSAKDIEIALLRKELEQLRIQIGDGGNAQTEPDFITLKLENVCKMFNELKGSPNLVSFLFLCLLKMLPKDTSMGTLQRLLSVASLENIPLNLTAAGDMNVQGTLNIIKENNNVNFGNS